MLHQLTLQGNKVSWDFRGSDTRYCTHGMHTYLAAMIPAVANRLINETVTSDEATLFDPFSGGGSVLVEGVLKGLPVFGTDINPLAVILSKAKTTPIPKQNLVTALNQILRHIKEPMEKTLTFPENYKIEYWFKPYMLMPLTGIKLAIDKIEEEDIKRFFQLVFSATCRDVSLTYRNEVRLRRLVPVDYERFNPNVIDTFSKRAMDSIHRLGTIPPKSKSNVQLASVLDLPYQNDAFTNIVCSPPYGDERNGIPYSQFSKNMLIWLGFKREDLLNLKKLSLGGKPQDEIIFSSDYLEKLITQISKDTTKFEAVSFYNDYYLGLKEMLRVTSDKIAIVIGNRTLDGKIIDNRKTTMDLMEHLGAKLYAHHYRKLPSKRLPQMGPNFGAQINQEDILVFEKN